MVKRKPVKITFWVEGQSFVCVCFNSILTFSGKRLSLPRPRRPIHKFWYYLLGAAIYGAARLGPKRGREAPKKVLPQASPIFGLPQPRIWPHPLISSIHRVGIFTLIFLQMQSALHTWVSLMFVTYGFEIALVQTNIGKESGHIDSCLRFFTLFTGFFLAIFFLRFPRNNPLQDVMSFAGL